MLSTMGCSSSSTADCDPDAAARTTAGDQAVDCGSVAIGADSSIVDRCVVQAFMAYKPFRAHYDRQGTDSKVVQVVVGTAMRDVSYFFYDSDPSGGSGAHPTLDHAECVDPHPDAAQATLLCDSMGTRVRICG